MWIVPVIWSYAFVTFELEFNGPVNTVKIMLSLGWLTYSHFSRAGLVLEEVNQYFVPILSPVTNNALLESRERGE